VSHPELNAAIVMAILPVIIVYMRFRRYFVFGLVSGAAKGRAIVPSGNLTLNT
jgi:raffinose/stachyose/melibiose transport system permease protein